MNQNVKLIHRQEMQRKLHQQEKDDLNSNLKTTVGPTQWMKDRATIFI